jgi:hypothetical protein
MSNDGPTELREEPYGCVWPYYGGAWAERVKYGPR